MRISPYSIGTGDRFGRQGRAQLAAVQKAAQNGIGLDIVWNKSHREHLIVKTTPAQVRKEADEAVSAMNWSGPYFTDADHIGMGNVDLFLEHSDFFTIDVADYIGNKADGISLSGFEKAFAHLKKSIRIPGLDKPIDITGDLFRAIAEKYLFAVQQAGVIYRHITKAKGGNAFITEISMDETNDPQTPVELLVILAAIAHEGIPVQTIAPKFYGRFNKGVDYIGDINRFAEEFEADILIARYAAETLGLPDNLKLSIHSGSDKFRIYPVIGSLIRRHKTGIHLKTAGTTWLEELIGLAEAGGNALDMVKEIYDQSLSRYDELCAPYLTVIDIDKSALPAPGTVRGWHGPRLANALRHRPDCPDYDINLRQLLHVGYKIAAEMGDDYLSALDANRDIIAENVTNNLYKRHIAPLFLPEQISEE